MIRNSKSFYSTAAILTGTAAFLFTAPALTGMHKVYAEQTKAESEEEGRTEEEAASVQEAFDEELFPSWNSGSESLLELLDFVSSAADTESPDYLEPEERIAVFDMDGTILCEKAPIYVDYCLMLHRVLEDPAYEANEEEYEAACQIREHGFTKGEIFHPETISKKELLGRAFKGMTPEAFRSYVQDFADNQKVVGFEEMTYAQSFYRPMLELIDYLRANDFDIWMVSACERDVVRALVERLEIPFDHVIGTDMSYVSSKNPGKEVDEYNMEKDEEILLGGEVDTVECGKSGKATAIVRQIGRRPVLAFGNSSGDFSMLNYAEGNPNHTGMGFFVVCDDTVREYGDQEKAAEYYETVEQEGWTAISMAEDWKTIYGQDVIKTELLTAEELASEYAAEAPNGELSEKSTEEAEELPGEEASEVKEAA